MGKGKNEKPRNYLYLGTLWKKFTLVADYIAQKFSSEYGLIILSLILSTIIITIVRTRIGFMREYTIPVKIHMQGKNMALSKVTPGEVKVMLKGTQEDINILDEDSLVAELVVREERNIGDTATIKLSNSNIKNVGRLRVDSITPRTIDVTFDEEGQLEIPLALPEFIGTPLQGTATARFDGVESVLASGSAIQLGKLKEEGLLLPTKAIDISGRIQSFSRNVEVLLPPDIGIKAVKPQEVKVFVDIKVDTPPAKKDVETVPSSEDQESLSSGEEKTIED